MPTTWEMRCITSEFGMDASKIRFQGYTTAVAEAIVKDRGCLSAGPDRASV